jgi:uncharacterized protein YyaL (SSP411 family)
MSNSYSESKEFKRNNLDKSSSPYLLQHTQNPIWWQEWNSEVVHQANKENKLLFVSVGYTTCHWCHVMASGAFSDNDTADYMNANFISVKVDREQRPDIDQLLMDFINTQNGRGGWPLNVFMTPDLRPVYALTYAPAKSDENSYSLLYIAQKVLEFYQENEDKIPPYRSIERKPEVAEESALVKKLSRYYDSENGGFGSGQKFPPHSSLLYLLFQSAVEESPSIKTICIKTLDAMKDRGLNDHLQGGIFRYCIDREWTIPHFEKMLYDQAMSLWCFSLAYKVIGHEDYRIMSEKILKCLDESFYSDGLYLTGLDADTSHKEGDTYLWHYDELKSVLSGDDFKRLSDSYFIEPEGNFDGAIHLVRNNNTPLPEIEEKLLEIRKRRIQPQKDTKFLSGLNSLLAVAFLQASRFLDKPELAGRAKNLVENVLNKFWDGKILKHSSYNGFTQNQNYLFDASALLTSISMIYEEDRSWEQIMKTMTSYLESFRDGGNWRESWSDDFHTVYASWSDHPIPSSVSLTEMALTRVNLLMGNDPVFTEYREPFITDFYNISAMINNGLFHLIESEKFISWDQLPVNTLRIFGKKETDCYMGSCSPL